MSGNRELFAPRFSCEVIRLFIEDVIDYVYSSYGYQWTRDVDMESHERLFTREIGQEVKSTAEMLRPLIRNYIMREKNVMLTRQPHARNIYYNSMVCSLAVALLVARNDSCSTFIFLTVVAEICADIFPDGDEDIIKSVITEAEYMLHHIPGDGFVAKYTFIRIRAWQNHGKKTLATIPGVASG